MDVWNEHHLTPTEFKKYRPLFEIRKLLGFDILAIDEIYVLIIVLHRIPIKLLLNSTKKYGKPEQRTRIIKIMRKHRIGWIVGMYFFLNVYMKKQKKKPPCQLMNPSSWKRNRISICTNEQRFILGAAWPEDKNYQQPVILFHSECQMSLIGPSFLIEYTMNACINRCHAESMTTE